jgi:hypothetical protein
LRCAIAGFAGGAASWAGTEKAKKDADKTAAAVKTIDRLGFMGALLGRKFRRQRREIIARDGPGRDAARVRMEDAGLDPPKGADSGQDAAGSGLSCRRFRRRSKTT